MQSVETTCCYCGVGCGITVNRDRHGHLTLEGAEHHPSSEGRLCSKGRTLGHAAGDPSARLQTPLLRSATGELEPTDWDTAMASAAERFAAIIAEHGPDAVAFYGSGQCLTEEYYLINKLAKGFIGTNNFDTNSRLCMSAAVVAYKQSLGADAPPISYDDLECCDTTLVAGANPAWAHPIIFRRLEEHRARNPDHRLIVVDPRRTDTAEVADLHLAIQPGTDVALLLGLTRLLVANGSIDEPFISQHTNGWDDLAAAIEPWTLEKTAETCGLHTQDLVTAAEWIGHGRRFLSMWTMGLNQSTVGVDKSRALINLHLATGTIGKPGCGPFSLTGQPNAMGGREVGGMANLCSNHRELADDAARAEVAAAWGVPDLPAKPGLTAVELFQAIETGQVKAVWVIATNPAASLPDINQVARALQQAELVVVQDAYPTDTSAYADVVLPAATWLEKNGTMTNSERRIARVRKLIDPPGEARPDWRIIADLATRLGHAAGFAYQDESEIFAEHAALSQGMDCDISGLSYERLADNQTFQWPVPSADHPGTDRLYTDFQFVTPDGRARFAAPTYHDDSEARSDDFPLILTTGRLRDQWHTQTRSGQVVRLKAHEDRPRLDLHPDDADQAGISDGQAVAVVSARGRCVADARISDRIRAGTVFLAMHWGPKLAGADGATNACTSPRFDPISKQPELKTAAVRIEPAVTNPERIVIIGGGAAAHGLLDGLQHSGHDLHLIAGEPHPIYDRVQLPHLLDGSRTWQDLIRCSHTDLANNGVTRHQGPAIAIDRERQVVTLASGSEVAYDRLVLATGSRPRELPLNPQPSSGALSLRTREQAEQIITACQPGTAVSIIGGGLLGLEVADALTAAGATVTIIQRSARLMGKQLDQTGAEILREHLENQGITILLDHPPRGFEVAADGSLTGVRCGDDRVVPCQVAITAAGTTANAELAAESGLDVAGGIVVDDTLTTADPRIHAIGECASWQGQRVGTTAGARAQAAILVERLRGHVTHSWAGWTEANILKIRDLPLAAVGEVDPSDDDHERITCSDPRRHYHQTCVIRHDRLIGAIAVGNIDGFAALRDLVAEGIELEDMRDELLRPGGTSNAIDGELVCSCNRIGSGTIDKAIAAGCSDLDTLCSTTKAGTGCGSCRPEVARLLSAAAVASDVAETASP